ncbi:hypothetical protein [Novosphingobium rosa]|uniref:hypothetical protein n=1 Tax=Novosphingobium rosa TaxID=76978 RepID=UPI00082B8E94|nr:hypothetical protein [Novosphingobium rosa]
MFPITGLRLLLPAIVPSWRFFDAVSASPRLDYALLPGENAMAQQWHAFRPRPAVLPVGTMLRRLFWNPDWNESLFLVSLSERLMHAASPEAVAHSQRELLLRVARHLDRDGLAYRGDCLQIRLRLVTREEREGEIIYLSAPCPINGLLEA